LGRNPCGFGARQQREHSAHARSLSLTLRARQKLLQQEGTQRHSRAKPLQANGTAPIGLASAAVYAVAAQATAPDFAHARLAEHIGVRAGGNVGKGWVMERLEDLRRAGLERPKGDQ
jgi:hypothetical protein